jgi:hypothetical protein
LAAYQAELARQQAAARAAAQTYVRQPPSGGGGGGDCYGSDVPSYIVNRESGGSSTARNPSGAYGCFQIMPGTWGGTCSDLGSLNGSSAAAQTECANRLWAGGSGSSHWAQTR